MKDPKMLEKKEQLLQLVRGSARNIWMRIMNSCAAKW